MRPNTTRKAMLTLWLAVSLCTLPGSARSETLPSDADLHRIADAVDKRYNALASMEVNFSESFHGGGLARTESGTMWLKKPGKMLWQYDAPHPKLFVTDGKIAWFYVPGERQARRASIKRVGDFRSPLRYLLGHSKLEKEFLSLSFSSGELDHAGDFSLAGVPKGTEARISRVVLEITPDHRICRISIFELDGSVTEFRFSEERGNVPVADERFRFHPPAGVEVLEATELEP